MSTTADLVAAVPTAKLHERCQVAPSTLNNWVRNGVVRPSLVPGRGQRFVRWWTVDEAVAVRAIKVLRDVGCPMSVVETVAELVRSGPDEDGMRLLQWDGLELRWVRSQRRRSTSSRQRFVRVTVVLPVVEWTAEALKDVTEIDPVEIRRASDLSADRRPKRATVETAPSQG